MNRNKELVVGINWFSISSCCPTPPTMKYVILETFYLITKYNIAQRPIWSFSFGVLLIENWVLYLGICGLMYCDTIKTKMTDSKLFDIFNCNASLMESGEHYPDKLGSALQHIKHWFLTLYFEIDLLKASPQVCGALLLC